MSESVIPPREVISDAQRPIEQLRAIVERLRAPDGCPWDREQTHATLRAGLIEEAYEVVEAINRRDDANLCEELGDLLLQSVFHAQIAAEERRFNFDDVARGIAEKLLRRHPHVFGDAHCADSAEVLRKWDEIKRAEKVAPQASVLDGVSGGLPALLRAEKVQKKAARVGFDWTEIRPVLDKIREELAEVELEIPRGGAALEEEVGDLLFAMVNLARKLKIDGETALHGATEKFSRRFRSVESLAEKRKLQMDQLSLPELDRLWEEVKGSQASHHAK